MEIKASHLKFVNVPTSIPETTPKVRLMALRDRYESDLIMAQLPTQYRRTIMIHLHRLLAGPPEEETQR